VEVVCEFWIYETDAGLEKYKDIETLDVNASLDQMEKAASAEPLRPMPLFVLTQGQPFDLSPWQPLPADFPGALNKAWHAAQDRAGDTCTKRQTQNRDQELALHSSPGTAIGG
jgi:hypothetical protein